MTAYLRSDDQYCEYAEIHLPVGRDMNMFLVSLMVCQFCGVYFISFIVIKNIITT